MSLSLSLHVQSLLTSLEAAAVAVAVILLTYLLKDPQPSRIYVPSTNLDLYNLAGVWVDLDDVRERLDDRVVVQSHGCVQLPTVQFQLDDGRHQVAVGFADAGVIRDAR